MPLDPAALRDRVLAAITHVNETARAVDEHVPPIFGTVSLTFTPVSPPELGFLRALSFLFCHYFEAGRETLPFVMDMFEKYGVDGARLREHYSDVQQLRTFCHHNLSTEKQRDREITANCGRWFERACGTKLPTSDEQWLPCYAALLESALEFLESVQTVLNSIATSPDCKSIVDDFVTHVGRVHPPESFDSIIYVAAADLGREYLDVVRFRNRFYDRWVQELSVLSRGYDFGREARKLVERALLDTRVPVLPITGADIISALDVEPGPRVAQLLRRSREIFDASPCPGSELLERLKSELQ